MGDNGQVSWVEPNFIHTSGIRTNRFLKLPATDVNGRFIYLNVDDGIRSRIQILTEYEGVEQGLEVSDATRAMLVEFHSTVAEALDEAVSAVTSLDAKAGRSVGKMKGEINDLEAEVSAHQIERLTADAPDRVANYRLEIDVVANLKRIYYFAKRMARTVTARDQERAR